MTPPPSHHDTDPIAEDASGETSRDWANLLLWAEGELPEAEVAVLQRRVADDATLAAEMERAFAFSASMRHAADEALPNFVIQNATRRASSLTAEFAARPAEERRGQPSAPPPVESDAASLAWRIGRWPLAAAAALVVGLMIYGLRPPPTQSRSIAQQPAVIEDVPTVDAGIEDTRNDRGVTAPIDLYDDASDLARLFDVPLDDDASENSPGTPGDAEPFDSPFDTLGTNAQLATLDERLMSLRDLDSDTLVDLEFGDDLFGDLDADG